MKKYLAEITAILYLLAFFLGVWGFRQTGEFKWLDACYGSLRLFILEFDGNKDNTPALLEMTRFFSPLLLGSSLVLTFREYFTQANLNRKIRNLKRHTIVFCEDDPVIRLIKDTSDTLFVTRIFNQEGLTLKAKDKDDIGKAKLSAASKLILLNDDATNLDYMEHILSIAADLKEKDLYIKLENNINITMFNRYQKKETDGFRSIRIINTDQLFSREVFLAHPVLDFVSQSNRVPYALICGTYEKIKWLVFEMANISHYSCLQNTRITLAGTDAEEQKNLLLEEFPGLEQVIDLSVLNKAVTSFTENDLTLRDITAVYVSEDTLEKSQLTAGHLRRLFHISGKDKKDPKIVIMHYGFPDKASLHAKARPFNDKYGICTVDYSILEKKDIIHYIDDYESIAEAIHEQYRKKEKERIDKENKIAIKVKGQLQHQSDPLIGKKYKIMLFIGEEETATTDTNDNGKFEFDITPNDNEHFIMADQASPEAEMAIFKDNQHLKTLKRIDQKQFIQIAETTPLKWEELSEPFKLSNRYQACHTAIKLGYLGYRLTEEGRGKPVDLPSPTPEQLDILAQMEKRRWNAERRLAGWVYHAKKDPELLTHDLLIPWEDLDEENKQKDRDTMDNITKTISALGLNITNANG